jgi:hypothetical protein
MMPVLFPLLMIKKRQIGQKRQSLCHEAGIRLFKSWCAPHEPLDAESAAEGSTFRPSMTADLFEVRYQADKKA